jgi:AcrR family transcriptional regulator
MTVARTGMRKQAKPSRRRPQQPRAHATVNAVLDPVARVLKRKGAAGVTTNRIAELAGVSIGSVYQYFPDKLSIFVALRERHVEQMARLVEGKLVELAKSDLESLITGLVDAMLEAHTLDPGLHELLLSQLPRDGGDHGGFGSRVKNVFRLAVSSHADDFEEPLPLERIAFVLSQIVEALAHGAVLRRPASLSLAVAKEESVRAVLAYLRAHGRTASKRTPIRPRARP